MNGARRTNGERCNRSGEEVAKVDVTGAVGS